MIDQNRETVLPDDYPCYYGYWYLFDGEPKRNEHGRITVKELKALTGTKEIRRCDTVTRNLAIIPW